MIKRCKDSKDCGKNQICNLVQGSSGLVVASDISLPHRYARNDFEFVVVSRLHSDLSIDFVLKVYTDITVNELEYEVNWQRDQS